MLLQISIRVSSVFIRVYATIDSKPHKMFSTSSCKKLIVKKYLKSIFAKVKRKCSENKKWVILPVLSSFHTTFEINKEWKLNFPYTNYFTIDSKAHPDFSKVSIGEKCDLDSDKYSKLFSKKI